MKVLLNAKTKASVCLLKLVHACLVRIVTLIHVTYLIRATVTRARSASLITAEDAMPFVLAPLRVPATPVGQAMPPGQSTPVGQEIQADPVIQAGPATRPALVI